MQIKAADNKRPQLDALTALLTRADADAETRARIEREIRSIRSGEKGEREAAYEIEFHYGQSRNVMTIHDLRLEVDGRVAQIDHLIVNRLLQVWVCESKAFAEGVAVNEYGEWSAFYGGRPRGIPSPIEQNKRHVTVLIDAIAKGRVELPKRLGIALMPEIKSVVIVSNTARISRPTTRAARVEGLETVMKVEQLVATINRSIDQKSESLGAALAALATFVSAETAERLARQLAALHSPARFDWPSRFGLPATAPAAVSRPAPLAGSAADAVKGESGHAEARRRADPPRPRCESCNTPVSDAVVSYCRANATRFAKRILCMTCQRRVRRD